jgi:hypothetical protein
LTFQRGSQPHSELIELLGAHHLEDAQVHAVSSISASEDFDAIAQSMLTFAENLPPGSQSQGERL